MCSSDGGKLHDTHLSLKVGLCMCDMHYSVCCMVCMFIVASVCVLCMCYTAIEGSCSYLSIGGRFEGPVSPP